MGPRFDGRDGQRRRIDGLAFGGPPGFAEGLTQPKDRKVEDMRFTFHVVWQPAARRRYISDHAHEGSALELPTELWWKALPWSMYPRHELSEEGARTFADNLAYDQECDVHVYYRDQPGNLWYHSYFDGSRGAGWPSDSSSFDPSIQALSKKATAAPSAEPLDPHS